jgi:hypothetical protein
MVLELRLLGVNTSDGDPAGVGGLIVFSTCIEAPKKTPWNTLSAQDACCKHICPCHFSMIPILLIDLEAAVHADIF